MIEFSQYKITVIIPVYNVSQYLRKGLDSVVNQTLQDIEIIIVNDCSPDPEDDKICQEYANKDSRIVYIKHKKNLGLGGARNTGIKIAKAEYIGFMDSDDWLELNMYEILYTKIVETSSEIVCCGFKFINDKNEVLTVQKYPNKILTKENIKNSNLLTIFNLANWNKLWKKTIFIDNNIFFPEYLYYEDLATTPKLIYYALKINFIHNNLYNYKQNYNGITYKFNFKHIKDYVIIFFQLRKFYRLHNLNCKHLYSYMYKTYKARKYLFFNIIKKKIKNFLKKLNKKF